MKKIALVLLFCFLGLNVGAKDEVLKIGKYVVYTGELIKKEPFGNGVLTVTNKVSTIPVLQLSGVFNGAEVSEATLSLPGGYSYKGDLVFQVSKKPSALIFVFGKGGQVYDPDTKLIGVVGDEDCVIVVAPDDITRLAGEGTLEERAIPNSISEYIQFAEDTSYTIEYSVIPIDQPASSDKSLAEDYTNTFPFEVDNDKWTYSPLGYAPVYTVTFSNGTVIRADGNDCEKWEKPSGDYIELEAGGSGIHPIDFYIHVGDEEYVKSDQIRHIFENGNVYEGTYNSEFLGYYNDYRKLIGLKGINWKWSDFYQGAGFGELKYSDGSRYDGSFSPKTKQIIDNKLSEDSYYTGSLYDRDGRIIHEYRDGKNEIQFAEETKRAEEERQRRQKAYEESLKTDFVEFDALDPNYIRAFKKTCRDNTIIEGENFKRTDKYEKLKLTYSDGTVFSPRVIVSTSISSSANFYKHAILPLNKAPEFTDIKFFHGEENEQCLTMLDGKWVFSDGWTIEGNAGTWFPNREGYAWNNTDVDFELEITPPIRENGDCETFYVLNDSDPSERYKNRAQFAISSFTKTFSECAVMAKFPSNLLESLIGANNTKYYPLFGTEYQLGDSDMEQPCLGEICYNDGSRFEGYFTVNFFEDLPDPSINEDWRLEALGITIEASIDNMILGKKLDGREYNSDGTLTAIYKEGKQLSEFEVAQAIAKDNAKRAEEEAKIKREKQLKEEYERRCAKYGKKYVDSWELGGTILVGTPEEYFLNSVDRVQLSSESEYSRCYYVYTRGGDLGLSVYVDKSTNKITRVYDHRHRY